MSERYRYRVHLTDDQAVLEEKWTDEAPNLGIEAKCLTVVDNGETTSIRFSVEGRDGSYQAQGILVPTKLFRQFARWSARTDR